MADQTTKPVPVHPLYQRDQEDMRLWFWSQRGGREYLRRYLTRHPKEHETDYGLRLRRAVYPNLVNTILSTYASQVYRSPVNRAATATGERGARLEQVLNTFWADADRAGNGADELMEQVVVYAQRDGVCGVLIDRPRADVAPATVAEEEARGVRPYAVVIERAHLVDWDMDEQGRPLWIIHRLGVGARRNPILTGGVEQGAEQRATGERYRYWDRDRCIDLVWDADGGTWQRGEAVQHGLGVVPVEFVFWGQREGVEPIGQSAIRDICPMVLRLTNLLSLQDEEAFLQVFNILVVGEDAFKEMNKVQWSTGGVLMQGHDDAAPFYLSPDPRTIESLGQLVNDTSRWIRQMTGAPGQTVDGGYSPPSGLSMSYQSSDKFALFKRLAGRMEDFEARLAALVARWEGAPPDTLQATITYPVDFDPVMIARTMEDALAFAALGITGRPLVEVQIQAIRRLLNGSLDPTELDKLIDEFRSGSQGASPAAAGVSAAAPTPLAPATPADGDGAGQGLTF